MTGASDFPPGALSGVKVLDLSRILAGPTCTQLLGDLGASVLKIENPNGGDDTRQWGPPFATDEDGNPTDLSAYFMAANRNKRSIAVDIATPEGQAIIRKLASQADILIENFKAGGLEKYGLDYESLSAEAPHLVYCSISGFGQYGPNAEKPGYDLMAQGFGGIMSLTGDPEGTPMKVGVGIADVMCGMYATVGILAALRHKDQTGEGQHIDIALVDAQIAWLINEGVNYLVSDNVPKRRGNAHPNIVPYDVFETADGHVILAVGNDSQFFRFCDAFRLDAIKADDRFKTNPDRIEHRLALTALITEALKQYKTEEVIERLEAVKVPVGPVNNVEQVFNSGQVAARNMKIAMEGSSGTLPMIGNPLKFSRTPVTYRRPPPHLGADTESVLESKTPFDAK